MPVVAPDSAVDLRSAMRISDPCIPVRATHRGLGGIQVGSILPAQEPRDQAAFAGRGGGAAFSLISRLTNPETPSKS